MRMKEEEVSPYDEIVAHREKIDAMNRNMVPSDIDAYGYLEGVLQRRWPYEPELARCARDLLPYQRPKLSVQVQVGESFAEKLEEVLARRLSREQQVNQPKVIEAKPVAAEPFKRRV
jgi:hypothetical protein